MAETNDPAASRTVEGSFNYAKCCKVVTIGASFVYRFFAVVVLKVFSYRPSHGLEQLALATPQSGVRLTEVSI